MQVFLGFGSNHGDRRHWLREGIEAMVQGGLSLRRVSPVVESPALLPAGAPWDWNRPFLHRRIVVSVKFRDAVEKGTIPVPRR
ncbi:MAG: hypothetical protein AAFX85_06825, partial [Pseudomonadota bacterium]